MEMMEPKISNDDADATSDIKQEYIEDDETQTLYCKKF